MDIPQAIKPPPRFLSPKTARRLRLALWVFGGLAVGVVLFYFVATSSRFIKSVILPRLGKSLNATVTAEQVTLSPLRHLRVRGFKLQTTGPQPLIQAEAVEIRYSLWSIIFGRLAVSEFKLSAPQVRIVQNADGTSNLDPVRRALAQPPSASSRSTQPAELALKNLALEQGALSWTQNSSNGLSRAVQLANLNFAVDQVQNGAAGKLTLAADLDCELRQPASAAAPASNSVLQAKISGGYNFKLRADLWPQVVTGAVRGDITQAQGNWAEAAALAATLDCEVTPTAVDRLALRFLRAGNTLGELRLSGPLDLPKKEGHLRVEIASIDRQVLNLFGSVWGLDFRQTTLNSSSLVEMVQQGKIINASGRIAVKPLSLTRNHQTTSALDLGADYEVNVDLAGQNLWLRQLTLTGTQGTNDLLRASLDKPMNLAWGSPSQTFQASAFQFSLTNLNLADWGFLLGPAAPSGVLSLNGKLEAQKDGRQFTTDLSAVLRDLKAQIGTEAVTVPQFQGQLHGQLDDYQKLRVSSYRLQISDQHQSVASCDGSLSSDFVTGDFQVRANLDAAVPALLQRYSIPLLYSSKGSLRFTGLVARNQQKLSLNGKLTVSDFTGGYYYLQFQGYQAAVECDAQLMDQRLRISQASVSARQNVDPGGSCSFSGLYDLTRQGGDFDFKLVNLNQNAFGPIVATTLLPRKLISATLNATGNAHLEPNGQTTLKAEVKAANLVLGDASGSSTTPPVNFQFVLDAALNAKQQLTLNQLALTFLDGTLPSGQCTLTGSLNLTNQVGQAKFRMVDLNQRCLRPWLAPLLAPRSLASLSLNADGTAEYASDKESKLKLDLSLTNLVVNDPATKSASKPLAAQAQVETGLRTNGLEVRQLTLHLPATDRAANQLQLTGRLDWPQQNVLAGHLDLRSESLDVTPLYDLFAHANTTNAAAKSAAPTPPPERAALSHAFQDCGLKMSFDRFYLREIAITNWQTALKLNGSEATVDPCQFSLNGAAVQAKLSCNLGVAGYAYTLGLRGEKIPVEPLANTFAPATRGQYQGNLYVQAQLNGAGLTSPNLQTNLAGQLAVSLTNANVAFLGPKAKFFLVPVALALQLPDLSRSPIDAVSATAHVGQGSVKVDNFSAFSPAFVASSQGAITLAAALADSALDLPVTLALPRSLAEKSKVLGAKLPADAPFVQLPSFVKIAGTLTEPKTDIDKLALAQMGLRSVVGLSGLAGTKTGVALEGVSSLLGGNSASATNLLNLLPGLGRSPNAAQLTNALPRPLAGTNQLRNLISNLATNTNALPRTATNKPAPPNPFDLLRGLLPK